MVLAQQTNTILLDEPTTYLDIGHQLEVLELLSKLNKEEQQTIVMVLHDINHEPTYPLSQKFGFLSKPTQ